MKKLFMTLVAAATMCVFTGCDEVPSKEVVTAASYAVGTSSGLVVKLLNIDENTKTIISKVIEVVSEVTPAEDQTFEQAWTPVATKYINELVASGKINETVRDVLVKVSEIMFKGIDLLFEKHPKWKQYPDVVIAAINGFTNGFKLTIGCSDCTDCNVKVPRGKVEADAKTIAERCGMTYK